MLKVRYILRYRILNLDSEADESEYDVIRDLKANILTYQLLKLFCQSNVLKIHKPHEVTASTIPVSILV